MKKGARRLREMLAHLEQPVPEESEITEAGEGIDGAPALIPTPRLPSKAILKALQMRRRHILVPDLFGALLRFRCQRTPLVTANLVSTTAVIVWLRLPGPDVPSPAQSKPMESDLDASEPPSQQPALRSGPINPPRAVELPTDDPTETADADTDLLLDASGHLVENLRLRDAIERLLSSNPGDLEQSKRDLVASLPPAAAQQLLEMVERFVNYRAALRQALPESPQAMSEQDALTMLETVHALRVTYFGPELTEAFFGAEEALGAGNTSGGETQ